MKKSMMILICVLLCMFVFTAGVTAESIFPEIPAFDGAVKSSGGLITLNEAGTDVPVSDNVIDITDNTIA